MANIPESGVWVDGVFQLETDTPPIGGVPVIQGGVPVAGHANAQALQLADRTKFLKTQQDALKIDVTNLTAVVATKATPAFVTAAVDTHNHSSVAHLELSAFITSEADRAEAAADVAQVSGNIYADTVTGLAATTSGQYFSVPSAIDTEYLVLYKNNAGVADPIKEYPSAVAVQQVLDVVTQPNDPVFEISDSSGHVILLSPADGSVIINVLSASTVTSETHVVGSNSAQLESSSGLIEEVVDEIGHAVRTVDASGNHKVVSLDTTLAYCEVLESQEHIIGDNSANIQQSSGLIEEVVDSSGHAVRTVDSDGLHKVVSIEAQHAAIDVATIRNQFKSSGNKIKGGFLADINHIIYYGQSWSLGFDSVPAITTEQLHDTIMFNGGVRQLYSVAENPLALQSFEPAVEATTVGTPEFPTANLGETGAVAMCRLIKDLILSENNLSYTEQNYQLLVSVPGEGSKQIEDLADNTKPFMKRVKEQISRGFALAQEQGKTYNVPAVTWIQGTGNLGIAAYPGQMEAMRADISAYAQSVTGQTNEVYLITWEQYPSNNLQTSGGSATGVYERFVKAADTYPYIICSAPAYQHEHISVGNIHFKPIGQRDIGEELGLAFKRTIIDNVQYEPLRVSSLVRQGKLFTITLNIEDGMCVKDTTQVVEDTNSGFRLYDSLGTELPISSITITGPNTIRGVCPSTIPAGCQLRYASVGTDPTNANKWRGNIRDNNSELTGVNRWLVAGSFSFDN